MNILLTIITALLVTIGGLFGMNDPKNIIDSAPREDVLGSDIKLLAGFPYYLAGTGISSSGTSFTLTNFTIKQSGYEIQDSDLEDTFYFTLEPGNPTRQEIVACTTVVQNSDDTATISGCSRGLSPIQPYTASTTLQFAHAGGSAAILSDPPQLFDDLYDYVNSLALGSTTVAATTLASGFVELATQAEMAASAILGGSGSSLVLQSQYATSSCDVVGAYVTVTDASTGKLHGDCVPSTYASSSLTIGSTPILDIGKWVYATTSIGTSTWSVPTGISYIWVTAVGPGGDGASCTGSTKAGGGGGGGYVRSRINVTGTTSIQFHVGDTGEDTTFGSYITAGAGTSQTSDTGTGAAGGTATGGTINVPGGAGFSNAGTIGGRGGSSLLGFGGQEKSSDGNGNPASNYGAGGGGAYCSGAGNRSGGAGTNGAIFIEY